LCNASFYLEKYYSLFLPTTTTKPATSNAATIIIITVLRAAVTGNAEEGVEVGGTGVIVKVGDDVGHGVIVGNPVGVCVGKVDVGVYAAWIIIF
jgi:hypothetical protein